MARLAVWGVHAGLNGLRLWLKLGLCLRLNALTGLSGRGAQLWHLQVWRSCAI
jgi:hypothetical protein